VYAACACAPAPPSQRLPAQGGHSYLSTAVCAAADAPEAAEAHCAHGSGAHHGTDVLHAGAATTHLPVSAAALLASLTLRVPGLTHLEAQARSDATAPLAAALGGCGASGAALLSASANGLLLEEASPRPSVSSACSRPSVAQQSHRSGGGGGAPGGGGGDAGGAHDADGADSEGEEPDGGAASAAAAAAVAAMRRPGAGLAARVADFDAARAAADEALLCALRARRAASGAAAYARTFEALGAAMTPRPGRVAPPIALDTRRWALQAERLRLADELAACMRARWYARLLQLAADGGRGGVTRGEAAVLERVKRGIEARARRACGMRAHAVCALRVCVTVRVLAHMLRARRRGTTSGRRSCSTSSSRSAATSSRHAAPRTRTRTRCCRLLVFACTLVLLHIPSVHTHPLLSLLRCVRTPARACRPRTCSAACCCCARRSACRRGRCARSCESAACRCR
jgi:hypothetical protein